ncbi:MAG: NAD(P)H-binding protein [Vicinamibacterales bacterium]
MRKALLAGATGLVGRACLRALLDNDAYSDVVVLSRRSLDLTHQRLRVQLVDFERPDRLRPVEADDAFCALGTTMARAGSEAAFRAVDYLAVLAVADLALEGGARQFVLVSSVGADPVASNFYLAVKGEAEAAVSKRSFASVHILRPGLLLGDRQERRPAERLMRAIAPALNPLLLGPLTRYRAIPAELVGRAMVAAALRGRPGVSVLHYPEMLQLTESR